MDWTCIMGRRLMSHVRVSLTVIGILQLQNANKRYKDLGALLDSCCWDNIGNFLQTFVSKTQSAAN